MADPKQVEDVTLGEIVRTLADVREELRALRGEHVRRDLYEAHRSAVAADIERLSNEIKAQQQEKKNRNLGVLIALVTAGLGLVVQLVLLLAR